MTLHQLGAAVVTLALLTVPAVATEAITTAAGQEAKRAQLEAYTQKRKDLEAAIGNLSATINRLVNSSELAGAFTTLGLPAGSNLAGASPTVLVALPLNLGNLSSLTATQLEAFIKLQRALVSHQEATKALETLNGQAHTLTSLVLAPSFQVNTGGASASYVPSIDFIGQFPISAGFDFQFLLSVKPDPPSGSTDEVAQSIRINTGVLNANIGLNYSNFWKPDTDEKGTPLPDGPQGVEIRVGIPVAYQRAAAAATGSGSPAATSSTTADFGLFSPEVKLSLWLKYVLVGYKYNYYIGFGASNQVSSDLSKTSSHKAYIAARIDALSGKSDSPFYVEATYTGKKSTFVGGTFSIAFSKGISWTTK
jgi:hypothetical protein